MRFAMGVLGGVFVIGGVGWAVLVLMAAGMSDNAHQAFPSGAVAVGVGLLALGIVMLSGAIVG